MVNQADDVQPPTEANAAPPGELQTDPGLISRAEAFPVPRPRLPEGAVQPALFRVPRSLTTHGQLAFWTEINRYVRALTSELERESVEIRSKGGVAEHTAADVSRVRSASIRRLQSEIGNYPGDPQQDRAVLATIMLTMSLAGLGVMPRFLHSTWQQVVFGLLIIIGAAGLVLTWVGRRVG